MILCELEYIEYKQTGRKANKLYRCKWRWTDDASAFRRFLSRSLVAICQTAQKKSLESPACHVCHTVVIQLTSLPLSSHIHHVRFNTTLRADASVEIDIKQPSSIF